MSCTSFPPCSRCGQVACSHTGYIPSINGTCIGYIGYPDCSACGKMSWDHDAASPHGISGKCDGYQFPAGQTEAEFQGQGGGYGGGGASGGW